MNDSELIERICRLPVDFYGGSKSMAQLVKESGIRRCLEQLTVGNLSPHFVEHPDLCEQWLQWSANKRVTSGWYFTRNAENYVVGFYPKGEVLNFRDAAVACAEFVVREVGAMATRR